MPTSSVSRAAQSEPVPTGVMEALRKFPLGHRYLAGVSGGRDSVALLDLLARLGYSRVTICHLNHRLRGRSSDADARFVERLSAKYGFPCVVGREAVAARAEKDRESIETAARKARYEFFRRVARARKCDTIFVAHHADDQVETFLFNLFRGAGSAGLGSMRVETRHGPLLVVRPLLGVWRSGIDDYIAVHRLKFREDATNAGTVPLRNRIRHRILPLLEKHFGRGIKKPLWRSAEILAAENEWIAGQVGEASEELSVPRLRAMPDALQRRLILEWLRKWNIPDAGFREVEAVRALLPEPAACAKVNLPGNLHARRRAKKLFIEAGPVRSSR